MAPSRLLALALLACAAALPAGAAQNAKPAPASAPPPAQQQPQAPGQADNLGDINLLTVFLPVMVFDKKNEFIPGLERQNFRVFEDGKEQKIESFESPTQLPLHVAVLLDTSNSAKRKLKFEQDAAVDFVLTIAKGHADRVLFATFDSTVTLRSDFTRNTGDLSAAIDKVKASGDTRLYDAVYRVCEEKMMQLPAGGRPVMVVVTDGEDTASDHTLDEAISMAQRADVTVFGISTRNYSDIGAGLTHNSVDKALSRLCDETGGRTFLPYQQLELARAFTGIAKVLRNEYVIYYTPENQNRDGKFRRIRVEVDGVDQKLEVNAKRGYFATPTDVAPVPN